MKNLAMYLLSGWIMGCGTGVSSDPAESGGGAESRGATQLLDGVLATTALSDGTPDDATYLAVVADPSHHLARLVRGDIRDNSITELDRMPVGNGAAQVVSGLDAIAWGFGDHGLDAGSFRVLRDGHAGDLSIGDRSPSHLLAQYYNQVFYTSTRNCKLEQVDVTTGQVKTWGTIGCFETVDASTLGRGMVWFRTHDAHGAILREMESSYFALYDTVGDSLPHTAGPASDGVTETTAWATAGSDGATHVLRTLNSVFPAQPVEIAAIPGAVDLIAFVTGQLWGATAGDHSTVFHATSSGVDRFAVAYRPRALFGLHDRLLVVTDDGHLVAQRLDLLEPAL